MLSRNNDYDESDFEIEAEEPVFYFCLITNLFRLVSHQIVSSINTKFLCERCLNNFYSRQVLQKHILECQK